MSTESPSFSSILVSFLPNAIEYHNINRRINIFFDISRSIDLLIDNSKMLAFVYLLSRTRTRSLYDEAILAT